MYEIEMQEMSEAFFPCWKAAGIHLSKQVDGGIQSWLLRTRTERLMGPEARAGSPRQPERQTDRFQRRAV
mgnify:CR=1 FL=1